MGGIDERRRGVSSALLALIFLCGLVVGGVGTAYFTFQQISSLKTQVSNLRSQVSVLSGNQTVNFYNITIYQNETALTELYENVKDSVVLVHGKIGSTYVQGSGFVYNYSNTACNSSMMVVITNYHVVRGTNSISVTFSNGNGYPAVINGTDAYADLAVLVVDAPEHEFEPLEIVSSSTLSVGEPVIAIGNPYGLVGSMTTGVVSALGRTIREELTGGFSIANIIQISAPINPGNSGGPLLNYMGKVVGVTTAIVKDSQGVGFAVPSNTVLREIHALVTTGSYSGHSYLGVTGMSMNYDMAQELRVNITYGWRIVQVLPGGPSDQAGVRSGDIIVEINSTAIRNGDDLSSYLEENTLPDNTITLSVYRKTDSTWQKMQIPLTLGQRPPPPG